MNKVQSIKKQLEILEIRRKEQDELEQSLLSKLREAEKEEKETKFGTEPQFFRVGDGKGGDYYVAARTKEEAIKTLVSTKKLIENEVRKRIEALGTQIIYKECACYR